MNIKEGSATTLAQAIICTILTTLLAFLDVYCFSMIPVSGVISAIVFRVLFPAFIGYMGGGIIASVWDKYNNSKEGKSL